MVREFSEEKRQEIFRLLDEIDMRDWKSFMEWCGSRKEEFGDWPDKLSVSAYTRYVDQYHEKVLEINEMTRQQVNTVFENVAEIDARYAARLREHREKVKEQIAIVKTMTEFMDSMSNDIPNKAHRSGGGSNENCARTEEGEEENTEPTVIQEEEIFYGTVEERGPWILTQCLVGHGVNDQEEISRIVGWVIENNFDLLKELYYADINGINSSQNKDVIYNEIMGNYYAYASLGNNRKVIELNCYWVREDFSLLECGTEECLKYISSLYQSGYVSEDDYRSLCYWNDVINHVPSSETDKIRNMMQERFDHIITTVYIYNCLQVLADRTFTPEECCEANEIFRSFGITDRNSIACLLICCAGESGGMVYTKEEYVSGKGYVYEERGAGYLQVTKKTTQLDCLQYIYDMYGKTAVIDPNLAGYAEEIGDDYPWESAAWFWAINKNTGLGNLNNYVVTHCGNNGGKLILGNVLTAESFVYGCVDPDNKDQGYTMDNALSVIVDDDSLRSSNSGFGGGWYVDINNCLHTPANMQAAPNCIFDAPCNWSSFESYYNKMQEAGLVDFDINTELP